MSVLDDIQRQRRTLLLLLVMIVLGLGAIGFAHLFRKDGLEAERQALAEKGDFQSRLARIAQEEKEIQAGDALFRALGERGILGEEKRMDWIEKIGAIQGARRLGDIRWEISPRRPLEPELAPGSGGNLDFMASTLRTQVNVLHEEDLLRFLHDLRDSLPAFVRIRQCSLERQPQAGVQPAPGLQMRSECHLDLITLTQREASAPKKP